MYTGEQAIDQNAPTFAHHIGKFAVDKNGLPFGSIVRALIQRLPMKDLQWKNEKRLSAMESLNRLYKVEMCHDHFLLPCASFWTLRFHFIRRAYLVPRRINVSDGVASL